MREAEVAGGGGGLKQFVLAPTFKKLPPRYVQEEECAIFKRDSHKSETSSMADEKNTEENGTRIYFRVVCVQQAK